MAHVCAGHLLVICAGHGQRKWFVLDSASASGLCWASTSDRGQHKVLVLDIGPTPYRQGG
jgi:hypothetical protein